MQITGSAWQRLMPSQLVTAPVSTWFTSYACAMGRASSSAALMANNAMLHMLSQLKSSQKGTSLPMTIKCCCKHLILTQSLITVIIMQRGRAWSIDSWMTRSTLGHMLCMYDDRI